MHISNIIIKMKNFKINAHHFMCMYYPMSLQETVAWNEITLSQTNILIVY